MMAENLTGTRNKDFTKLVQYIMKNLKSFKGQYCEGIPKLRLIKLMLIELAELKKVRKSLKFRKMKKRICTWGSLLRTKECCKRRGRITI
jgi:hypothetical protein